LSSVSVYQRINFHSNLFEVTGETKEFEPADKHMDVIFKEIDAIGGPAQ